MECELQQEVSLGDAPNTLMIGRVVVLHLDPSLEAVAGTSAIDPEALRPVREAMGGQLRYAGHCDLRPSAGIEHLCLVPAFFYLGLLRSTVPPQLE